MNYKYHGYTFQLMGVALYTATLLGCDSGYEEQSVLSVVNDGIALIEEGQVAKTMRLSTKDLLVQPGKINRRIATSRLLSFLRKNGDFSVLHPEPEVEIFESGDTASVSVPFVVVKKGVRVEALSDLYSNPEEWIATASRYTSVTQAVISLVKRDDRWLIRTIRFQ